MKVLKIYWKDKIKNNKVETIQKFINNKLKNKKLAANKIFLKSK